MAFNWNKFPWTNLHDLNLDWIIQTVKQLENRVAELAVTVQLYTAEFTERVQEVITNTLTGSGDLTIQKTGDVRITANSVQVTGGSTFIDHGDQVTLYDPDSKTGMSATYASSKLDLWNNQDLNRGVAVYHVRTPEEGEYSEATYPRNNFAASVGYVKTSVNAVSEALATETGNRVAGDNALQSTIDSVIMPLLNARGIRDFHVTGTVERDGGLASVSFDSENPKSELDDLLSGSTKVRLVVETPDETRYFNMCYNTATEYGFSGMYKAADSTAYHEMIVYDGTTFAIE